MSFGLTSHQVNSIDHTRDGSHLKDREGLNLPHLVYKTSSVTFTKQTLLINLSNQDFSDTSSVLLGN